MQYIASEEVLPKVWFLSKRNPYILINLLDYFILQDISRDFNHRFKSSRETFDMAVRLSVLCRSPSVRILR